MASIRGSRYSNSEAAQRLDQYVMRVTILALCKMTELIQEIYTSGLYNYSDESNKCNNIMEFSLLLFFIFFV